MAHEVGCTDPGGGGGSEDRDLVVIARRIGRRDDPGSVRLEVRQRNGRLVLSAVYPTMRYPGRGSLPVNPETGRLECLPEDPRGDFWYSDVRVDLVVRVPAGVLVQADLLDGEVNGPASLLVGPVAVEVPLVRAGARPEPGQAPAPANQIRVLKRHGP